MLEGAQGDPKHNWITYVDTLMQYHLNIEPSVLTDKQWAEKFKQLEDIRQKEAKAAS